MLLECMPKTDEVEIAPVKAVKILTISESTRANSRQISGTVKSANESALSFRVSGRVASVHAKTGDSVTQGQVLAKLESKEYELAVQSARAELASARSNLVEKEDAFKRQQNLKKKISSPRPQSIRPSRLISPRRAASKQQKPLWRMQKMIWRILY